MKRYDKIGTCKFMCPKREVEMREKHGLLHRFEITDGTEHNKWPTADVNKIIKEYSRPAAGKVDPRLADLRPHHVLKTTVEYLMKSVVPKTECAWFETYEYVADRLRAVRQDMVIQRMTGQQAVSLLEPMVRFLVYARYRLCEEPISHFDPKLNETHVQECLKRLLWEYPPPGVVHRRRAGCDQGDYPSPGGVAAGPRTECDCQQGDCPRLRDVDRPGEECDCQQGDCPRPRDVDRPRDDCDCRQGDFLALYLLFNLYSVEAATWCLQRKLLHVQCAVFTTTLSVAMAAHDNNFVRVFRLAKRLPAIHLCALHRHFGHIRRKALRTMSVAYTSRSLKYRTEDLCNVLTMNSNSEAADLCRSHGFTVANDAVIFLRSNFKDDTSVEAQRSTMIDSKLKCDDITKVICQRPSPCQCR